MKEKKGVEFDALCFIDDVMQYAKGVQEAGDNLKIPTLSMWFP